MRKNQKYNIQNNIQYPRTRSNTKKRKPPAEFIENLNIESISDNSIKTLFKNPPAQKIFNNKIQENNTMEETWKRIETNITEAPNGELGTRSVHLAREKREPCLNYIKTKGHDKNSRYIETRNGELNETYTKLNRRYG